jgi:hypothetical protein
MSSVGGVSGAGHFRTTPSQPTFGQQAGGIFKDLLVGGASFATGAFGGVGGQIVDKLLGGSGGGGGVVGTAGEIDPKNASMSEMLQYQEKVMAENRFWTTESNVIKSRHDMQKALINNFRA